MAFGRHPYSEQITFYPNYTKHLRVKGFGDKVQQRQLGGAEI